MLLARGYGQLHVWYSVSCGVTDRDVTVHIRDQRTEEEHMTKATSELLKRQTLRAELLTQEKGETVIDACSARWVAKWWL